MLGTKKTNKDCPSDNIVEWFGQTALVIKLFLLCLLLRCLFSRKPMRGGGISGI